MFALVYDVRVRLSLSDLMDINCQISVSVKVKIIGSHATLARHIVRNSQRLQFSCGLVKTDLKRV
ncbi:hypothetical protein SFRURICE_004970 [Spodoptera frugiperda]|nr:hypothetical protein SFRURICE_004970 [Spodoptera frugiperda]